jgi:hypothetical protein
MSLIAKLDAYPLNTQTMTFSVIINPCIVTDTTVFENEFDPKKTYLVYIKDTVGVFIPVATFIQSPACGYSVTNSLFADSIPSTGFVA